jgi:uncharacterized DUF497 family protein
MQLAGFDWDKGNWPKCAEHGVSKAEIESVFRNELRTDADPSTAERRFRAVGRNDEGRSVFVVYSIRIRGGVSLIRPISARYMHAKEVRRYEQSKA